MNQPIKSEHFNDKDGNPAGGITSGTGLCIIWQNGPLGRGEDRIEPNGAFVEGVISAAIDRLEYYQDSKFNCNHNLRALRCLKQALDILNDRTADREARDVEGTHEV